MVREGRREGAAPLRLWPAAHDEPAALAVRIDGWPARIVVWTAREWAALPARARPADARPVGRTWVALRLEGEGKTPDAWPDAGGASHR